MRVKACCPRRPASMGGTVYPRRETGCVAEAVALAIKWCPPSPSGVHERAVPLFTSRFRLASLQRIRAALRMCRPIEARSHSACALSASLSTIAALLRSLFASARRRSCSVLIPLPPILFSPSSQMMMDDSRPLVNANSQLYASAGRSAAARLSRSRQQLTSAAFPPSEIRIPVTEASESISRRRPVSRSCIAALTSSTSHSGRSR